MLSSFSVKLYTTFWQTLSRLWKACLSRKRAGRGRGERWQWVQQLDWFYQNWMRQKFWAKKRVTWDVNEKNLNLLQCVRWTWKGIFYLKKCIKTFVRLEFMAWINSKFCFYAVFGKINRLQTLWKQSWETPLSLFSIL